MPDTFGISGKTDLFRRASCFGKQMDAMWVVPSEASATASPRWGTLAGIAPLVYAGYPHGHETTVGPVDALREENDQLRAENYLLRRKLDSLEVRISRIEEALPETKVVVLRSITEEQAKAEIKELFSAGRTLYYSDIAEQLGLDLEQVVRVCEELRAEGAIEIDANLLQ